MALTVFVVGAGASKDIGLPVGDELAIDIAKRVRFSESDVISPERARDPLFVQTLKYLNQSRKADFPWARIENACEVIREGLPIAASIDNFLDAHKDNKVIELVGKLAIVRAILHHEGECKMKDIEGFVGFDLGSVRGEWYVGLWQLIAENCTAKALKERFANIAFVIFNYDRCIERFLYQAILKYYRLPPDEIIEILKSAHFFHPYGQAGFLSWQGAAPEAPFGQQRNAARLIDIASGIKTFTEGTDETHGSIVKLRKVLNAANRIVFLGFAYHDINLELLWPRKMAADNRGKRSVYGTAIGVSASDRSKIEEDLRHRGAIRGGDTVTFSEGNCAKLFQEYRKSIDAK